MLVVAAALGALCWPAVALSCGGVLTQRSGLISTPGFPAPLPVPVRCQWLIDSSGLQEAQVKIAVYFTQLFVTSGLTFTEYSSYDQEDPALQKNARLLLSITEQNSVTTRWLLTPARFLLIDLKLERLEGNHLRVLDHLLDVFGFNITYEMVSGSVRNDSCSVIDCSFAGNCYVSSDYKEFRCSCFSGFSGRACAFGPSCDPGGGVCLNGGVCRHAGKYPTCSCPPGLTGTRCEAALPAPGCQEDGCWTRCRGSGGGSSGGEGPPCDCGGAPRIEGDRWRYIMTLDVDNITALSVQHPGRLLSNYLESQITKFLRQFSLSRLEDVNILNISESGQTSFHLFGDPLDLSKVRLAQRQLSVTWRIGEVLLSKLPVTLRHEQGLRLEDIQANNGEVFENEQVILSCIAQGSEQMEFSWYKDGQPIDPFKGFGGVWMHILPKNSREEYTAILGIDAAKVVDEGWYTCQVMDWGVQECKSVYLEVEAPPDILVSPMAASVKKGDNIDLTCVSTNQKVSYTWSREKKLFPLNPDSEVWEDLKPWGSILRIKNVQKSVTYTCHALAKGATSEKSIHIDLLAPGSCKESQELEIIWKPTSPGSLAMAECPSRFVGYSSRYCLAVTPGESSWEEPDYSKCVSENLDRIMTQFQVISRGTMKTNLWTLLSELNSWLHSRALLHGEGESVLDLLSDVATLLNLTSTSEEVLNVTEVFYANVDLLLSQPTSFTHIEKVGKLQRLVDEWSLMWAQHLNQTSAYLLYSEIVIDVRKLSNEAYHQYYIPTLNSYPHWYTANIGINIASQGGQMNMVTVINYHNISNFLPTLSSHILSDGSELLYKVGSNVISISAYGEMKIRLDMMLPLQNEDRIKWNMSCARADTIGSEWDFTSCLQVPGAGNSSHCVCNRPGLYAALLTRVRSDKTQQPGRELSSPIIALGCSCCLVQSCLTLLLLCCRGAFMQLFKVQFCLAVSSIMAIFVHVTRVVPTKDMYMLISILLELLFFFALSSHLGKLLIVYSEVVFVRNSKNAKLTILGLTTGVSLLPCLISGTAESFSAGEFRNSWWLPIGSASFYTATASTFFITLLIIMLSVGLIRRLHYLKATKNSESNQDINRRLGLMKRTSVLFTMTVLVAISSVFLANKPTSLNIYIFSSLSGFLGFLIFVSYILHSESALNIQLIKQLRITANDRGLSSSSDYNLFNFCTKKESEAENRDIPLPIRESGTEMKEIPNNFFNKPKLVTLKKQSTIENEQRNIDLEVYPNSPRKFFHSAGDGTCCSTKIIPQIDTNKKNRVKTVISQRTDVEQVQLLEDDFPRIAGPSNVLDSISHDLDCLRNGCPPILRGKDCGLLGDGGPLGSSNSLGYLGKHNL